MKWFAVVAGVYVLLLAAGTVAGVVWFRSVWWWPLAIGVGVPVYAACSITPIIQLAWIYEHLNKPDPPSEPSP